MLAPQYFIYLATGPEVEPRLGISSNPGIDASWLDALAYRELTLLQPPQPLWIAETLLTELQRVTMLQPRRFAAQAKRELARITGLNYGRIVTRSTVDLSITLPELPGLEAWFWGRCLLGAELPEVIRSAGYDVPWDPENWMQLLFLQGQIQRMAAVGYNRLGIPYCRRCGATDGIYTAPCQFCGSAHCLTCTHCQTMGLAKSCVPLYCQPYPDEAEEEVDLMPRTPILDFELTPAQQRASVELLAFLDSTASRILVWAVCGGGKTEVSFGIIAEMLFRGGRVLVAIPRKDVVIELLPRFESAFPSLEIPALYGGSSRRHPDNRLVLATTHQCIRFYQSFDLVVLDEADAFPYQGSQMLHYAVERALKPGAKLVIMTATPEKAMMQQARNGKMPWVAIPARYHRQPLMVPQIVKLRFKPYRSPQWEMPEVVRELLLNTQQQKRKLLIFLPTIAMIETIGATILSWARNQGLKGQLSHSKRNNGNEVKQMLQAGQLDFAIVSTVFERGITIANLDVVVLFADDETIFDCRTLVQIAGRAGRKGEAAAVCFYAATASKAMRDCCQWIRELNQEGFRLGFLDREND